MKQKLIYIVFLIAGMCLHAAPGGYVKLLKPGNTMKTIDVKEKPADAETEVNDLPVLPLGRLQFRI